MPPTYAIGDEVWEQEIDEFNAAAKNNPSALIIPFGLFKPLKESGKLERFKGSHVVALPWMYPLKRSLNR